MTEIARQSCHLGRIAATIPVQDMIRAQTFYVELLGFEKSFQNGSPIGFTILTKGPAELHLTLQPNHTFAKFNIAHMMVGNIEYLYERLQQNKVRIIKSIQDKDYGLRSFVFEDPEGNRIDVAQKL